MSTSISDTSFASKVVVVTGAGRGLGRSHAIEFARRGARVVVNDLGGAVDGTGSGTTAQTVVDEIRKFGGEAYANTDSVTTPEGAAAIIHTAVKNCGRVDILVNNAGILRDKTFTNVTIENFREVLDVHLMGSVLVTKAAWPIMRENNWGAGRGCFHVEKEATWDWKNVYSVANAKGVVRLLNGVDVVCVDNYAYSVTE